MNCSITETCPGLKEKGIGQERALIVTHLICSALQFDLGKSHVGAPDDNGDF